MNIASFINLAYIAAAILFILGIKMLSSPITARRGNLLSAFGMLLAVVATLIDRSILSFEWILLGLITGGLIGALAAKLVRMTGMPELVALFNGFGGFASLLVGSAEYLRVSSLSANRLPDIPNFTASVIVLTIVIGGVTVSGSLMAYGKLSGKVSSQAILFPGQKALNALIFGLVIVVGTAFAVSPHNGNSQLFLSAAAVASLLLGILAVVPIGGGDMPVVIALLNSLSGLAAASAGFVILNNVLIVAGCLVGASGFVLTTIMCKAMNRSLGNVLFSGFGASRPVGQRQVGEMKPISVSDAYYLLEAARSVLIIPGYGMAVAQAQHAVKELGDLLQANGTELRYAIHPVAGRMPGHMNVLLAEADVLYENLFEMDDVNPSMQSVDVAIVIGANDVVNPAAIDDAGSSIYGMPIINAYQAKTVLALKRGQGAGFSGLINSLFFLDNTRMLYGDAKSTVSALVSEFKGT